MIACTNSAVIPFIAYRTATVTGATATGIATGGVIAIANIAGAVAPYLFRAKDAPRYYPGLWTLFGFLAAAGFIVGFLWWRLGSSSEYRGFLEEEQGLPEFREEDDEAVDKKDPASLVVEEVAETPKELRA